MQSSSAETVIKKCGGVKAVADMLGLDLASVHRWKYPRARGGTDGRIPTSRQNELLSKARETGVNLDPADFFDAPSPAPEAPAPREHAGVESAA